MNVQEQQRAADAQRATWLFVHLIYRILRRFGLNQHGLTVLKIALANFGEKEMAGAALYQAHAQMGLQLCHLAAEAGFGYAQFAAGGGKTTVCHHLGEEIHLIEVLSLFHI